MTGKAKQHIIQGVVAFVISVVMIVLGYHLNDYMARDDIRIEHLEFRPDKPLFRIPPDVRRDLENNRFFGDYDMYLSGLLFREMAGIDEFSKAHVTQELESFIVHAKSRIDKTDRFLALLKNGADPTQVLEDRRARGEFVYPLEGEHAERSHAMLEEDLKSENLQATRARRIVEELLRTLQGFSWKRTGEMQIRVTFLNSGNTDGLVREIGVIILSDGKEVRIRRDEVCRVGKRSMEQAYYSIDKRGGDSEARDILKELIQNKQRRPIRVRLSDVRNDPILSDEYMLPVLDEH